jgi:hypothetical protein
LTFGATGAPSGKSLVSDPIRRPALDTQLGLHNQAMLSDCAGIVSCLIDLFKHPRRQIFCVDATDFP